MQANGFKSIKDIAQIISSANPRLGFLKTPAVIKKIAQILPPQLKQILSDEAVLCDIFYYRTGSIDAGRAKFRVRTSVSGYAQILRERSSKTAIYRAICEHLRYCPDDAAAASMIKRRAPLPLDAAGNLLSEAEFAEFSVVINYSAAFAAVLAARRKNAPKLRISRKNQPFGDFENRAKHPRHREQIEAIREAILRRRERVARIDAERAAKKDIYKRIRYTNG